jgi:hypothetical protein
MQIKVWFTISVLNQVNLMICKIPNLLIQSQESTGTKRGGLASIVGNIGKKVHTIFTVNALVKV